jgi:ABC-type dipeptide/oligopeptide/nickel transport system permease subunit
MICNPVLNQILGGGANCSDTFDGGNALAELMARLFRTVMVIGGIALLLYLAWGGLSWVTAGGDKGKVEEAKERITNAIMGMAVLVASVAIAIFLQYTFGFDLLNPEF